MKPSLYQKSLSLLLADPAGTGAFIACPNFPQYLYAWFRDGSFCAYALDRSGHPERSAAFHRWVTATLLKHRAKIRRTIESARTGVLPPAAECLHSRFTLIGDEVPGNWGHHQLDGLGTWLWALCQHQRLAGDQPLPAQAREAALLARDYLAALWRFPCSDCWEEHEDRIHPYTLGALYAGMHALSQALGDPAAEQTAGEIRAFLLERAVQSGRWTKSIGDHQVDSSLIGLAVPYSVLPIADPVTRATLREIDRQLGRPGGGYRRYPADTYYGGGEWLLLAAWRGWAACEAGDLARAREIRAWIESQATPGDELPEQTHGCMNAPEYYPTWVEQWGEPASPLLWSHAQYVILCQAIEAHEGREMGSEQ
jgi:GH15 family glucan-1,4-alpha-glucosidase